MKKSDPWLTEWLYRYEERIGILSDGRPVTSEMRIIAKAEADEAEKKLRAIARERREQLKKELRMVV